MLSITLDWLAFTWKEKTREQANFMALYANSKNSTPETAHHGYSASYRTQEGVICSWNDDRPEMGCHVVLGGSAIRNVCQNKEISQQTLLREAVQSGGSVTRLDLATDCVGEHVRLPLIWKSLQNGDNSGTARTFGQIESNNGGHTIYIGSRQSEKFIRIYDKAAQSDLSKELWFRFEIETKGMVARSIAALLLDTGRWEDIFNGCANGMVNLPNNPEYQKFFGQADVPIGIPKLEKQSDRERWIDEQVISAVIKHAVEHPDSAAVERLFEALKCVLRSGKIG